MTVLAQQGPGGFTVGALPGLFFVVLLLFGTLLSVIVIVGRSRGRLATLTADLYADVGTGLELLAARVDGLAAAAPQGEAAQALTDARDRLEAARVLRADSDALPVSRACRRILLEGLAAVGAGDRLAGRDPGPVPPPPTDAPLVEAAVRVAIAGREHIALPAYRPGFPHCYSGGVFDVGEIPGGWYAEPFWERLLGA